ncbi:MAG: ABC transporter ATP-binding protein [Rothia sp. (in: high G+C Gram-positive bacteria)]|nr:ABC transporter ATP-binding protein [Rothia sp. (in: high G+C Gram-positive bacteria)]
MSRKGTAPIATKIASMIDAKKIYNSNNVVDGVSFDLLAGKTTVLVGPNGSGKTTTMEMLVGLRSMSEGRATIAGIPVLPGGEHRFYTGVQLQSSGLPARIKTKEVIRAVECLYANPSDWRPMAAALGVDSYLDSLVDNLSGGERRRLDILCAAIGQPALLVLDEPTSGVDPEGRAIIWDFVRALSARGCAVLASTHDMAEAEAFADDLLVLAQGKIRLRGSVKEVLASLGGEHRLRITEINKRVKELVEESGLNHGQTGSSMVVIGEIGEISKLAQHIAEEGTKTEVLTGPVRLEDVFAVATVMEAEDKGELQ